MCQICYNRNEFGIGFSGITFGSSFYLFTVFAVYFVGVFSFIVPRAICVCVWVWVCARFSFSVVFVVIAELCLAALFYCVSASSVSTLLFHWSHIRLFDCFDNVFMLVCNLHENNEKLKIHQLSSIKSNGIPCVSVSARLTHKAINRFGIARLVTVFPLFCQNILSFVYFSLIRAIRIATEFGMFFIFYFFWNI